MGVVNTFLCSEYVCSTIGYLKLLYLWLVFVNTYYTYLRSVAIYIIVPHLGVSKLIIFAV